MGVNNTLDIDGGGDTNVGTGGAPPSLLTIVLDTNPHAWAYLSNKLPLSSMIANLVVFINAHLAINHDNQVAVVASHSHSAVWLYPTTDPPQPANKNGQNGAALASNGANGDVAMPDTHSSDPSDDANKYRPFHTIETQIVNNLRALFASTSKASLSATSTTHIASAITAALDHIHRATLLAEPVSDLPDNAQAAPADNTASTSRNFLTSRVLVLSVSGDLASQYISVMNAIFAAQRLRIPIDILKLAGDTVFLQQACDATAGIYMAPVDPRGLLQYLMMAFLPDQAARTHLVLPSKGEVDFRAACFCHRNVVDLGWICSVCLSIFCEPLNDGMCLTCGTRLSMTSFANRTPALVQRKRKKKKTRVAGEATPIGTPSGAGTPS